MPNQQPPTLDAIAAARWAALRPASDKAGESPWLHEEVARRMEERLKWIKLQPRNWAHWAPLRGGLAAHELIRQRYPQAAVTVVEPAAQLLQQTSELLKKPWWQAALWRGPATQFAGELAPASVQMLWANMALHPAADPQALLTHWQQALSVDGFLMFSCLGPDTLRELRALYQAMGWPAPAHEFTDMHDWGDMLVQAGFAEPVMDMERIRLSFETPERLLLELRGLGRNLSHARFAALRGRHWRDALHTAMAERLARPEEDGRLTLTFEVIYGHAFKAAPRLSVQAETSVSLDEMREALRQRNKNSTGH